MNEQNSSLHPTLKKHTSIKISATDQLKTKTETKKIQVGSITNARGATVATTNGGGASEQNEAGAVGFRRRDGGERVATARTRRVLIGVPIALQVSILRRRMQPRLRTHPQILSTQHKS